MRSRRADAKKEKRHPRTGSGRGGSLGTPAMGDPPAELKPDKDPRKGYAVSGGGIAHPADDEEPGPRRD